MITRIIASLALVPILIFLILGGIPLYLAMTVITILALYEFYKAFKSKDIKPLSYLGYIFGIYTLIKNTLDLPLEFTYLMFFLLFVCSIVSLLKEKSNIVDISATFIGIFYVAMFFDYIVLTLKAFTLGEIYVWIILLIAFATDTFAYFSGYLFGKHKLIPNVSPKKTVEGAIGGILGSTICCAIFGYLFDISMIHMFFMGSIGSIIAQLGDLFASSIKRYVGIKDYGKLIPGHGGILDRIDSIILVAPFVYYSLYLFI